MPVINFVVRDHKGQPIQNTSFKITSGVPDTGYEEGLVLPAATLVTTDSLGAFTATLVHTEAPYYLSKANNTTDEYVSYKFFVPDVTNTLTAEFLYVDVGLHQELLNDRSLAALIDAKVSVHNRAVFINETMLSTLNALVAVAETGVEIDNKVDSKIATHAAALDPHGDRAYVSSTLTSAARIKAYGAVSGQNATTALTQACTAAVASGTKTVIIDVPSLVVNTSSDCQGCRIIGYGATLTSGTLINTAGVEGLTLYGVVQGAAAYHPEMVWDSAVKALVRVNANTIYVFVKKPSSGYALLILRNNATTNTTSLATGFTEPTPWRICSGLDSVEVLVGCTTPTSSSGTWEEVNMLTDVPTHTSGGIYKYIRTPDHEAWAEFNITVPEDGKFNIGFICTSSSSTSVTIYVDDVVVDAMVSLYSDTPMRRIYEYTTAPGTRLVKIKNNLSDSSSVNLLGVNFSDLKNANVARTVDTIGWYRNSANIDPLDSNSANDYAIYDLDSNKWGGSYHGGENNGSLSAKFFFDGVETALPAVDSFILANDIRIRQTSKIDWAPFSAAYLNLDNTLLFHVGGFSQKICYNGNVRARSFFTTLFGMSKDFVSLVSPVSKTLADIADNGYFSVGPGGQVTYEQASGKTRATISHSQFVPLENFQGSAYIWRVPASYNKYYYGPVVNGERAITAITAINRFVME